MSATRAIARFSKRAQITNKKRSRTCFFEKVVGDVAYGWAVISTIKSKDGARVPYFDLGDGTYSDHIPDDTIPGVAAKFMSTLRVGKDMHTGTQIADVLFCMPVTEDIAKALAWETKYTGLAIGWRPHDKAILEKIANGERLGFSIGGGIIAADIVDTSGKVIDTLKRSMIRASMKRAITKAAEPLQLRVFREWDLGEISLVDFPMQAPALVGIVKSKPRLLARTFKTAVLTSLVDGHQHVIDLDDPTTVDAGNLSASYQTAADSQYSHTHAWVYDPTSGAISIAADSGHTHDVMGDAVVPADVLAAVAAMDTVTDEENAEIAANPAAADAAEDELEDGDDDDDCMDSDAGTTVIAISMRAKNSTPGSDGPTVKSTREHEMATTENDKTITELTKRADTAERGLDVIATMSDAQLAHYKSLSKAARLEFVAKSNTDRDAAVKTALELDPEVYKSTRTGKSYRQSQRDIADMAKEQDETHAELAKARTERDAATYQKVAGDAFKHLAFKRGAAVKDGAPAYDDGFALVKAIYTTITDATQRDRIFDSLKAADAVASGTFENNDTEIPDPDADTNTETDPADPIAATKGKRNPRAELTAMAEKRAQKENVKVAVAKTWLLKNDAKAQKLYAEQMLIDKKRLQNA